MRRRLRKLEIESGFRDEQMDDEEEEEEDDVEFEGVDGTNTNTNMRLIEGPM